MSGEPANPRWRPKFGLQTLMFAMVVCCMLAAVMGGLMRGGSDGASELRILVFVALAAAGPMLLMILLSLAGPIKAAWRQLVRRR